MMAKQNQNREFFDVLTMQEGTGASSYHRNSSLQASAIEYSRHFIQQSALETAIFHGRGCETIQIADLGSASGMNAVDAAKLLVEAFHTGFMASKFDPIPDLFVFFNDLPSNDFNTLFKLISDDDCQNSLEKTPGVFTGAVSGSFHGRLFPDNSLHFVFSSYALQWMSQVPEQVNDKNSSAWNPGNIYFTEKTNPAVAQAYATQFQSDFLSFLRARGEEIINKGRMVLLIPGTESQNPIKPGRREALVKLVNYAFQDMVGKGLLSEYILATFNLPLYYPSVEELIEIVHMDGQFQICKVEFMKNLEKLYKQMDAEEKMNLSKTVSKHFKAIFGNLVEAHIGKVASAQLFDIIDRLAADEWEKVADAWSNGGYIFLELQHN